MTDKQIIIDGVDVSGCKYFCKFTTICRNENIGRVVRPRCKNVVDCYYKQLKLKEQECEELKETLAEIKEIAESGCYDNYGIPFIILQKISECEVKNE